MSDSTLIACVDDASSVTDALKGLLSALGFRCSMFASAEGLLESGQLAEITCIIADVQLPGMSGLELHEQLIRSGRPIPVILITGFPDERIKARALSAGVISYLVKPVPKDELIGSIRAAFAKLGRSDDPGTPSESGR